jgi:ArsR family transcriptional regulator
MEELSAYFKSLADPTRLRILHLLLQQRQICGCELQHVLGISQPNVSRHLTYLKNSGLVVCRREGPRVCYRLADDGQPHRHLFGLLDQLFRTQPELRQDRARLRKRAAVRP